MIFEWRFNLSRFNPASRVEYRGSPGRLMPNLNFVERHKFSGSVNHMEPLVNISLHPYKSFIRPLLLASSFTLVIMFIAIKIMKFILKNYFSKKHTIWYIVIVENKAINKTKKNLLLKVPNRTMIIMIQQAFILDLEAYWPIRRYI